MFYVNSDIANYGKSRYVAKLSRWNTAGTYRLSKFVIRMFIICAASYFNIILCCLLKQEIFM